MAKQKKINMLDYNKKNRRKLIRTVFQILFLVIVLALIIDLVMHHEQYTEPDTSSWNNKDGFIALSYFGVSRNETPTLIEKQQLEKHFKSLKNQGYVTISQQDILNFYKKGKPLPEKALFLVFEDGRNDSSIFAQPLLEKYNFKATILTYANKFGKRELKFLQPKELIKMKKTGFWEVGSNGYRLTYINIFDEDNHYFDIMDESEFQDLRAKTYNHYLMDFIRDENGIPVENRSEMEVRVSEDYALMNDIYRDKLGFIPKVYAIMHANSLYNGMNSLVSGINDKNIRQLFAIHFNREGYAFNDSNRSKYDLTRVQAAPHWATNHLLMKLQEDTGQRMIFEIGDEQLANSWELVNGAAEFIGNKIILTSPASGKGMIYLKDSDSFNRDLKLSLNMHGIPEGRQSIYLRYDQNKGTYLQLVIENHELSVVQKTAESPNPQVLETVPTDDNLTKHLQVELHGDLLTLSIDDYLLFENFRFDHTLENGGIALVAEPKEEEEDEQAHDDIYYKGQNIYDITFTDIKIEKLEQSNGKQLLLYSNAYNGIQKAAHHLMNIVEGAINWTMDTF